MIVKSIFRPISRNALKGINRKIPHTKLPFDSAAFNAYALGIAGWGSIIIMSIIALIAKILYIFGIYKV